MPSEIGPPPPGIDLNDSLVASALWATYLPWSIMIVTTILRFASRRIARISFWWDDWLVIPAALLTSASCFATSTLMIPAGMGRHIWAVHLTFPPLENFWKGLFINEATYAVEIACVKLSVLCLYWRLFKLQVRWWLWGLGAITLGWAIGLEVSTFLLCRPLDAVWNKTIHGQCLNEFTYAVFSAIPNFVTDLPLLCLPIPIVWKLHTAQSHKILLTLIFCVGYFVAGVSIARFVVLYQSDNFVSPDITWNSVPGHNWSLIEMNAAVISANLPVLKPILGVPSPSRLYSYFTSSLMGLRSRSGGYGSSEQTSGAPRPSKFSQGSKFSHLDEDTDHSAHAWAPPPQLPMQNFDRMPSNEGRRNLPGNGVLVENELRMSYRDADDARYV